MKQVEHGGSLLVLFDLNGTLVDDLDRALSATNDVLTGFGLRNLDAPGFRASFTLPLGSWLRTLGVPEHAVPAAEARWSEGMETPCPLREGAAEILEYLRREGAVTGVVSAVGPRAMRRDLRRHGLLPLLDHVYGGVSEKAPLLRELAAGFASAYYVGDTAYDVTSAREAGITSVALSGGHQLRADLLRADPDCLVESLTDVGNVVRRGEAAPGQP